MSSAAESKSDTFIPLPTPVRSRCNNACCTPISAFMPALISQIETPMRPHGPGAPLTATRPLSACTSKS